MILFLYGKDTYRSNQRLKEIIVQHQKAEKKELNLIYFDFGKLNLREDDYQRVQDEIQSLSIFYGKKLIIIKNAASNESFQEKFFKNAKRFINSKDVILFFEEGEVPEKNRLVKFLRNHGSSEEFELLEGEKLKKWAEKEFKGYQTKIDPKALSLLLDFVGNDLWQLSNEIKKIINYKKKQEIEVEDIELLVRPKVEAAIFETIDAIASRNKKRALSLIHKHLERGDPPLYLLSMINFQFRNLLMVKSQKFNVYYPAMISKKLGIHPYVARKAVEQSKRFSLGELKKIYQKIFQLDLAIKTGKLDGGTALDLFISEV